MSPVDWNRYKGDFVKFDAIGTSVEGDILSIEEGRDFNGGPAPQLTIDTAEGVKKVTAGQVMLQRALAEKQPQEGDRISITYYANGEGKPGQAPAKLFKVDLVRAGEQAAVGAADLT